MSKHDHLGGTSETVEEQNFGRVKIVEARKKSELR
jgi:hypothetical protein